MFKIDDEILEYGCSNFSLQDILNPMFLTHLSLLQNLKIKETTLVVHFTISNTIHSPLSWHYTLGKNKENGVKLKAKYNPYLPQITSELLLRATYALSHWLRALSPGWKNTASFLLKMDTRIQRQFPTPSLTMKSKTKSQPKVL